jgi:hypothetical protein
MMIKITIFITPAKTTVPQPELATAAPTNPPTRVCDELEGRPYHQVSRFHKIAAITAAAITLRLITSGFITPFPIVEATFSGKIKKAIKLKNAAMITAVSGESTLVETTVAIEFAES